MKQYQHYIIEQPKGNLQVIQVDVVDEARFLEDYGRYVLAKGNSIMEALQAFEQLDYHGKAGQ
jgi:hypothetical protein